MSKVLVDRELLESLERLTGALGSGSGWKETSAKLRDILAQSAEAEGALAERMRAAGMMTIEEMLAGAPLDRFIKHAGVNDLETYGQWLEMKCREFLSMQASRDLDKREDDDLYEWVLAHAAAFQEARINFKEARDSHLAALSAVTAERDRLQRNLNFTEQWYAERFERLADLGKSAGCWDAMAAIIANGTADPYEPPTYAQQLVRANHRADVAERERDQLSAEAERLREAESLLLGVCDDLMRHENADVRMITCIELNNWLTKRAAMAAKEA